MDQPKCTARFFIHPCKVDGRAIAFCWAVGAFLGILVAGNADGYLSTLIYRAAHSRVSVVGASFNIFLPFLLSAFAVYHRPSLLLFLSAAKAFSFCFCGHGVSLAFGRAAWLLRPLLLFSDFCLIPVLYLFWLRSANKADRRSFVELCICLVYAAFVFVLDYWVISPFLARLIR